MLKTALFAIFLLFLTAAGVHTASAADGDNISECGKPPKAELNTDGQVYCNIYDRQLAYGEEDAKFDKLLKERQANYEAPHQKVVQKYHEDIRKLHGFPDKNGKPADTNSSAGEAYGPTINR
jgi:hypothetical protein